MGLKQKQKTSNDREMESKGYCCENQENRLYFSIGDFLFCRKKVRGYAATSMNLRTKNEIFSAMIVYGFLNYENGYVSIPNKEVMTCFKKA